MCRIQREANFIYFFKYNLSSHFFFLYIDKPRSERYVEESTHYNDIKVSLELQKQIGAKVSAIINKSIEFVNIEENGLR